MDDINGIPTDEYKGPTFSINLHNRDGGVSCEGIYLHYGDAIIKVALTLRGFKAHAEHISSMAEEIAENLQSGVEADAERCVHPQGYIKSVRICGLCGEQL